MEGLDLFVTINFLYKIVCILFTYTLHEFSKGFASYKLGDTSPKNYGRLTLNPFKHVDYVGLIFGMFFGLGWSKPMELSSMYYPDRKKGIVGVNLIGIVSNIIFGVILISISILPIVKNNIILEYLLLTLSYTNIQYGIFQSIPLGQLTGKKIFDQLKKSTGNIQYNSYQTESFWKTVFALLIISGILKSIINAIIFTIFPMLNIF